MGKGKWAVVIFLPDKAQSHGSFWVYGMDGYKPSELIRQLRLEKGLTQEQLAEGICSAVTVSRIENGTQQPSGRVLELLLDRLGEDVFHTLKTTVLRTDARDIRNKEEEILHYIASGKTVEAQSLLSEIRDQEMSIPVQQQRTKYMEALLLRQRDGDRKAIQELLEEALRLTKPRFDKTDFRNTILTSQEMQIISFLSVILWEQSEYRQALRVSFELSEAMERKGGTAQHHQHLYICVLINQIQFLETEKRYDEAYEICRKAERLCKETDYMSLYPELLFSRAKLLFFKGKSEESAAILKGIYPYLLLAEKNVLAEKVRSFAAEKHGLIV